MRAAIQNLIEWCNQNSDFLSLLVSIITVIVAVMAIYVPSKIAKRQDKIALYSKRFLCYEHFKVLKEFSEFIQKYKTFDRADDNSTDPVLQCQSKYMDAHNLLVDEEVQKYRFDPVRYNMYVLNCLEKDRYFITTTFFLLKAAKEDDLQTLEKSLTAFVEQLFKQSNEICIDKIKETRDAFVSAFSKVSSMETELKKTLDIGRK